MASTTVLAVSIASSVPMSGRSLGAIRRSLWLSSITIAFEPVTETMRPMDLSDIEALEPASGIVNCMVMGPLTMRSSAACPR